LEAYNEESEFCRKFKESGECTAWKAHYEGLWNQWCVERVPAADYEGLWVLWCGERAPAWKQQVVLVFCGELPNIFAAWKPHYWARYDARRLWVFGNAACEMYAVIVMTVHAGRLEGHFRLLIGRTLFGGNDELILLWRLRLESL